MGTVVEPAFIVSNDHALVPIMVRPMRRNRSCVSPDDCSWIGLIFAAATVFVESGMEVDFGSSCGNEGENRLVHVLGTLPFCSSNILLDVVAFLKSVRVLD